MPGPNPLSAPDLPFPIFQISQEVKRYLLYDIRTITWLRQNHNILGVLIGTLPQIPQQNVFLGLPLELQPEEARILVEKDLAYVVDDLEWHTKELKHITPTQIGAAKEELQRRGVDVARKLKTKQCQAREARRKPHSNSGSSTSSDSNLGDNIDARDTPSEETLFGDSTTQDSVTTKHQASNLDVSPWTITPTSSSPFVPSPPRPASRTLPPVNASSYALFKHLHSQGYFISPGIRFGCQFSVYPGDPLRFHSHFLAMSVDWDEEIDLLHLVAGGRLGTGVKKGWLIGGNKIKETKKSSGQGTELTAISEGDGDGEDNVRTFCLEWGGM